MGVLDTGVGPPRSGEQDTWGLPGCPQLKNAYDQLKKRGEVDVEMLALEDAAGGGAAPAPQPAKTTNPASKSTCASASSSRNTTPAMKKMNMKSSKTSGSAVESALSSQQEPLGDVEMRDATGSEDRREDHHQRRRVTFDESVVDHDQSGQVQPGAASSLDGLEQRIAEKSAADLCCAADMLRDVTKPNPTFPTALQFVQKVKENFEEKLSLKVLVDEKDLHN
eukprot:g19582.t1